MDAMKERDVLFRDDSLVEFDLMMPSQFFRGCRRRHHSGERLLVAAILADAMHVLERYGGGAVCRRRPAAFVETKRWIESRDTSWVFSFERVCEALQLDSGAVRRRLLAPRRRVPQGATIELGARQPTVRWRVSGFY